MSLSVIPLTILGQITGVSGSGETALYQVSFKSIDGTPLYGVTAVWTDEQAEIEALAAQKPYGVWFNPIGGTFTVKFAGYTYVGSADLTDPNVLAGVTPIEFANQSGGGGGYTESTIANDIVTLDEEPAPITFISGADNKTISAWKVKVNGIDLEYQSEEETHVKTVDGVTYAVGINGDDAMLYVDDENENIIAGTYTVNIVSPPTMYISANGQVNVSDIAAVSVNVQPTYNRKTATITLDANSNLNSILLDFLTVTEYSDGTQNITQPSPAVVIFKGSSKTITVYDDTYGNSAQIGIIPRPVASMTDITGAENVQYSDDKTLAIITRFSDNANITVS